MAENSTNSIMIQFNESSLNFSTFLSFDIFNQCFNMDCIFSRALTTRLPVLRPLTAILILIGFLGFVGNVFVILVYSRTTNKKTSTYLILMLAITDLIACSLIIPGTLLKEWFVKVKSDILCKLWELLRNYAIISSATTLGMIALDRFLLVYRNRFEGDNSKVTLGMVLIIVCTGISLGIPPMLGIGVYIEDYEDEQVKLRNIEVCLPNDLLISEDSLKSYWLFLTALFGTFLFTIIVLYFLIFILVYKHSDKCKGIHLNQQTSGANSQLTRSQWSIRSILPFAGFSKSTQRTNRQKKASTIKETKRNGDESPTFPKIKHIINRKESPRHNVQIHVISNTASEESTSELDNTIKQPGHLKPFTSIINNQQPSTSGLRTTKSTSLTSCKPRQDSTPILNSQRITSRNQRQPTSLECHKEQQTQIQNTKAHVKTTQVLCIITTVYIVAFLPMFLIIHDVIKHREILFYLYFINNAANPVIYSFMNRRFRVNVWRLLQCKMNQVWPV